MSLITVYLGLGSNIERERNLTAALNALSGMLEGLVCSPVFESEAVGIKSAPFINFVVRGQTDLSLAELSAQLKHIEANSGRYAPDRKGLPLDIDILLYGESVGDFDGLVLPRAEILKNAFVLWPLSLLAGTVRHPVDGRTFAELWQEMPKGQRLWPVAFSWQGRSLTPSALCQVSPLV
ncbi:2-amino-4-hydroxy-6-hydroxymethyldihydropteridine diphosphokinase [Pseudomonas duriflava]|uniref:2-amino-4-hydroxy-6-hydroxymethyldihydropteridine diphosphokinase n=1 Tax=Pseudomonas duriflava TaxID=459528 RepID=A0A562QJF2_9PSED|nr:2-amino-4-hydroxy-6-hydroxymethyldihydropteridine diphosphokinase [Pseudomonas duriflava]TWI56803.1 2-amino-4-hydroxy-6-hydroxymethyldihydropteridine diphosphokinase [Pseudomonas duriflava]